jgi:hypothetical protein
MRVIDSYGLDISKVVALVSDTAANMNVFGKLLAAKGVPHLYCIDHVLQLTAKLAFDDRNLPGSGGAMKCARALCEVFAKSTQAMDKLKAMQRATSDSETSSSHHQPLKMVSDVCTRWWSTHRMLSRLLDLKPFVDSLIDTGAVTSATKLLPEQTVLLKEVRDLLEPFAEAQRSLEGEKYVTISMIPYAIWKIRKTLKETLECPTKSDSARHLARVMHDDFVARFGDGDTMFNDKVIYGERNRQEGLHKLVLLTAALHPGMKKLKPYLNKEDRAKVWDLFRQHMEQLYNSSSEDNDDGDEEVDEENAAPLLGETLRDGGRDCFFDELHGSAGNNNSNLGSEQGGEASFVGAAEICNAELLRYLQMGIRRTADPVKVNPLSWWYEHKDQLPILYQLAQRYLSIPATSAPSERIWSQCSLVITKKRNRLSESMVTSIIALKVNTKFLAKHAPELEERTRILPKPPPELEKEEVGEEFW